MTQRFKVEAIDDDGGGRFDTVGAAEFELGELMGSKNNLLILHLILDVKTMKKGGQLIVRSEEVVEINENIFFKVDCQNLGFGGCCGGGGRSFLVLSKPRYDKGNQDSRADWLKVYQTPVSQSYNGRKGNPNFPTFELNSSKLCSSDYNRRLKLDWYEYKANGSHVMKGQLEFSVAEITGGTAKGEW